MLLRILFIRLLLWLSFSKLALTQSFLASQDAWHTVSTRWWKGTLILLAFLRTYNWKRLFFCYLLVWNNCLISFFCRWTRLLLLSCLSQLRHLIESCVILSNPFKLTQTWIVWNLLRINSLVRILIRCQICEWWRCFLRVSRSFFLKQCSWSK